ncbi:LOW QUALITY PROTEIN: uncharacterized protein T551_01317 [Pneumocystis jirovecii RU7]|uniref:Uncharacterized protein n=1 Tax=Pneumocystis jirovecii (strain RU7) TaxID=1408657 RepID=A0A0W4ZS96_PNEJ7|nr:LOW QUALITY PROTEIN: uncharacterized protein T551_01317 [Pneumocystis jirovecii RU7]KTW31245.1 LOW QUALITY PROTEIN: hypothetical protein T551_01317 [Pneumocystis jirovecii RU7]
MYLFDKLMIGYDQYILNKTKNYSLILVYPDLREYLIKVCLLSDNYNSIECFDMLNIKLSSSVVIIFLRKIIKNIVFFVENKAKNILFSLKEKLKNVLDAFKSRGQCVIIVGKRLSLSKVISHIKSL